jgi:hypothetical protein
VPTDAAPAAAPADTTAAAAPTRASTPKKRIVAPAKTPAGTSAPAQITLDDPAAAKSAAAKPAAEKPAPVVLPDVVFGKLKLLIVDDTKTRDRDAALKLGRDSLAIVDGDRTLHSAPYSDVIGVYYSHSREPRWATADGQSLSLAKAGSTFGFFRGTPDWITVRTKKIFIPLRVREDDVRKLSSELEARTGTKVVTTK